MASNSSFPSNGTRKDIAIHAYGRAAFPISLHRIGGQRSDRNVLTLALSRFHEWLCVA